MTDIVSPSTDLLQVGKGIAVFKPVGSSVFYDMGNAPEIELTPASDKLDHFSSREGTKTKDLSFTISKTAELRIVLEEFSHKNLAMLTMATIDETDPENPIIEIGAQDKVSGEFRFYGMNDRGPKYLVIFPSVDFLPSGSLNLISDEFGQMEVTGSVNVSSGRFGTMQRRTDTGNPPVNIAAPPIVGGGTEGDTLTAGTGTWLGEPTSYSYVWKRNGVAIGGATASTYVLTAPDIHASITVTVTAVNANGSDTATSAARVPTAY
jgi:hypothetical protein